LLDRLRRSIKSEPDLTWLQAVGSHFPADEQPSEPQPAPEVVRRRRPRVELSLPLVLGGLIVLGLFIVVLFGPLLAPENPYLAGQRSSMTINGEFTTPPFPPMPGLPLGSDQWGRDILSMLLYGTRNTLVACLFIAMARVLLGAALGMLAGWNEGGLLDRAVMGLVELTTALPALLTGMILILALGIQRGIGVFIVALCFVGWAEIAQFIRSEFMVIRRKPFIEGARSVGLDGLGIAVRHILPNILPSLVIIAVLEMGAVLMILGELGFIGTFIGGGTWVQVGDTAVANIPDIPEWGAMMAGARQFARAQTWMVFYPALAFFLAVLGFNLLGEGLRRIVQKRGVSTAFILSKRILLVILGISLATAYIVTHVGPAPSYAGLAQRFDAQEAIAHVQALTTPEMEGRQAGTPGADAAAAYVAARFAEYGLEPASPQREFRVSMTTRVVEPTAQPELALLDGAGAVVTSFVYRTDFCVDIRGHGGAGRVEAPLVALTFSGLSLRWEDFRGLDLRGRVALCLADEMPAGFDAEALIRGAAGLLVVEERPASHLQLADEAQEYLLAPALPFFRISPAVADALLSADGLSASDLHSGGARPTGEKRGWQAHELSRRVRMSLALTPVHAVKTDNVLGLLRGTDAALNKQLVIVASHYDGPGRQPDGALLPSANEGASGMAAMLEILRLWKARGFQPRRTMLFAAWSGGEWDRSGTHEYAETLGQYSSLQTVAVVNLDGLGRGGDQLVAEGDQRLADLLQRSAESSNVRTGQGQIKTYPYQSAFPAAATLSVGWQDDGSPAVQDTLDRISATKLGEAGQSINLMLFTLCREYEY
jgi:peptide/nickel transport system permease protein